MQANQIDEKYAGGREIISLTSHPASLEVASISKETVKTKFGEKTPVVVITDAQDKEYSVFGAQPRGVLTSDAFADLLAKSEDGLLTIFFGVGKAKTGNDQLQASFLDVFK